METAPDCDDGSGGGGEGVVGSSFYPPYDRAAIPASEDV